MDTIENKVKEIKETFGLELTLCDYFTGIKKCGGKEYFNILIDKKISESDMYNKLEWIKKYNVISGFEPNGVVRVAIYF